MKQVTTRQIIFMIGRLLTVSALCLSNPGLSSTAFAAKTFVYCSEGSPSAFNPQIVTDGSSLNAGSRMLFNRLIEFVPGETTLQPGLADSWKVSADAKSVTFKLRKGVKFHTTKWFTPTREMNADDVIFSFERQRKKDHPFHKVGGGTYEFFDSMEMGTIIKEIKKIDPLTVEFVLSRPEAPFLANLAMDFASIMSAEYAAKMEAAGSLDKYDQFPIGTGPFILGDYKKDTLIRYSAHPDYFRGKVALDKVIFQITPDPSVRFQKLKTNECQLAADPAPADLKAMRADPKITVVDRPGLNIGYLAFNTEKAPFNNLKLRQAVHHALNRKSYIDAIYLGNAVVAKNPIPPTIWSYNDAIKDLDYDVEKSKALLKEAGFPNGFETELWTLPVSRPYNPNGKKMGEMMQADLEKVGIKVKLVSFDWPTYLEKSKKSEFTMAQFGWTGDNGDPDNFFNMNLGCGAIAAGGNRARWCHKKFDELVEKARVVSGQAARTKLYLEAQVVFKKEIPWVTLAHSQVFRAFSKKVLNYKIDPLGGERFDRLDLAP